ncbi:MAG: diaminopimelate epimerase [Calditrichaeota bacterium]|nr:diaminopimelate epimerase [Calditrichota bacterium]
MTDFQFLKIQATGNDFVIADFDDLKNYLTTDHIKQICNRNFGVGADGVIALEKSIGYGFRFHYFNSDGSRGEMCANGCRAAVRYAVVNKWVEPGERFRFIADDGEHSALAEGQQIRVSLNLSSTMKELDHSKYKLPSWITRMFSINTGVPHLVLICSENLAAKEIFELGKMLRFHKDFTPPGTNVNFVEFIAKDSIFVRTFERGVDDETLSCGTGMTASAIIFRHLSEELISNVNIKTPGGLLKVDLQDDSIFLEGPSEISFEGKISL